MQKSLISQRDTKRQAFEVEMYSPIRQIGLQIGQDVYMNALMHNESNDEEMYAAAHDTQDSSIINHSTLSPQKLHIIREDSKPRGLESQPGIYLGEPLSANMDSQKRQRYGRPFTNSPFPYMQKRNGKSKQNSQQFNLPSTAATSYQNQLGVINQLSQQNGRFSGLNQPSFTSSIMQSEDTKVNNYNYKHIQNSTGPTSSYQNSTISRQDNSQNQLFLNYQDQFSPKGDSQFQNNNNIISNLASNFEKAASPSNDFKKVYQQKKSMEDGPAENQSLTMRKSITKEQSMFTLNLKDVKSERPKKRKLQTEPNSPLHQDASQGINNNSIINNSSIIASREMPMRLSGNKASIIKAQYNKVVASKIKERRPQQENSRINYSNEIVLMNQNENNQERSGFPQSEEKKQSFLPRLDASHRYSNSQVMYRELEENNKSDVKERIDMTMKSPTNNWINEKLQKINKKQSNSQDRKNPSIQVNQNFNEFNKVFKPSIKSQSKTSKNKESGYLHQNFADQSSSNINGLELKNIGKIMPMNEFKSINEQVIRGKIYKDKYSNQQSPSKFEQVMINVTRGNNMQVFPLTEVVTPTNNESPLNVSIFESKKMVQSHIKESPSDTFYNIRAISNLSVESNNLSMVQQTDKAFSQFNMRNYSVSQDSSKASQEAFQLPLPQFNTIEEAIRGKDQTMTLNSGQYNFQSGNEEKNKKTLASMNQSVGEKIYLKPTQIEYNGAQNPDTSGPLSKQFHHTIKTVASKQMPKCFRMSKQQLKQVGKVFKANPNALKVEAFFSSKGQQRSISNDARISFNDHQFLTIQKQNNNNQTPIRQPVVKPLHNHSLFNPKTIKEDKHQSNMLGREVTERSNDEDRERMTPAFNARQSYIRSDSNRHNE